MTQIRLRTHIDLQEYDRYDNLITYDIPTHGYNNGVFWDGQINATVSEIATALQEKRERDNPQPLTLEQLRQMDGQPVWCPTYGWGIVDTHFRKKNRISIVFARHWKIAQNVLLDGNEVYSNKPEESEITREATL